jgi:hypothetical protein
LSGTEKENALHISIKHFEAKSKTRDLLEIKKQVLNMKKNMLYSKTLDDKIIEIELNSSRSHQSGGSNSSRSTNGNSFRFSNYLQNPNLNYADILMNSNANRTEKFLNLDLTSKSDTFNLNDDKSYIDYLFNANLFSEDPQLTNRSLLLTNRTNKSVRFDEEVDTKSKRLTRNSNIDENEISQINQNSRLDPLTNQAVNERYKKLTDMVSNIKNPNDHEDSPFSLSLPLTPRTPTSTGGLTLDLSMNPSLNESSFISKEMSKSLESIYKQHNETFIKE